MESESVGGITPEKVVEILQKHGTIVTIEEAKIILQFIKKIAHVTVSSYLRT